MKRSGKVFRFAGALVSASLAVGAAAQPASDLKLPGELAVAEAPEALPPMPPESVLPAAEAIAEPAAAPAPSERVAMKPAPLLPAPAAIEGADVAPVETTTEHEVEMITERYGNGAIKVERYVTADAQGNYVNHGPYKMYDERGGVLRQGEYVQGKQQGLWTQNFATDEGHLFSSSQDNEFVGPFVSEASFDDGRLHGAWTIRDGKSQPVIEWNFDHGVRDGQWTWWYAGGQKKLEATYEAGLLNGEVVEYDREGNASHQTTYIGGRFVAKTVGWYTLGKKHFEGFFLRVPNMSESAYDWWTGSVTSVSRAPAGEDQKHGVWIEWYPSGNKKTEAQYDHGQPIGQFTWWYENGQKEAEGEYLLGKETGTWTTWHFNGLKESQAEYQEGRLVGKWLHWDAEGRLVDGRVNPSNRSAGNVHRSATTGQLPNTTTRSR